MDAFLQKPIPKDNDGFHITFLNKQKPQDNENDESKEMNEKLPDASEDNMDRETSEQQDIKSKKDPLNPFVIVDKSENRQIKREDFFNKDIVLPEEEKEKPKKIKVKKTKKKLKIVSDDKEKEKKVKKTPILKIDDKKEIQYDIEEYDRLKAQIPLADPSIRIANQYYLNNKKGFISFMNSFLYDKKMDAMENISCDALANTGSEKQSFALLPHQEIVREYLNTYTPYRGLLLFHGLGSGKTCSSIAIAEGMKTDRPVLIMTPASLRMNYIQELKKCGDPFFRRNQHWSFLKTEKDASKVKMYSDLMQISETYIKRHRGIWITDRNRPSNYKELSSAQKASLNKQFDEMVKSKYEFINYNGLRMNEYIAVTSNFTKNIFSNKVIVIDEAHNLISRIVNKLMKNDTKSLSYQLYQDLMMATNCKIVLLSGTPIINYTIEMSVLFNILRGFIKVWYIKLSSEKQGKINQSYFQNLFSSMKTLDYIDYYPSTQILSVMRNPYQFVNDTSYDKKIGILFDKNTQISDAEFQKEIVSRLESDGFKVQPNDIEIKLYKALPDDSIEFLNLYIDSNQKANTRAKLKNENMLKRRIIGLTSYFKSPAERLMPAYDPNTNFHEVYIPMSDEQFAIYNDARHEERIQESNSKKRERIQEPNSKKRAKKGKSNTQESSTYRIFSRLFCNFVFPSEIERPLPKQKDDLQSNIEMIDENIIEGRVAIEDDNNVNKEELEKSIKNKIDDSYDVRLQKALEKLKEKSESIFSKDGLKTHSPKYLHLLENITNEDYRGLHLIYSQFLTLEGLGIFSLVLEEHGYARFRLKNEGGKYDIEFEDGKPHYVMYTGSENETERELIRNIFNGDWKNVPASISRKLKKKAKNNHYGEIIKVFMITQSGAEGISLKNVRFVHLMEPYWHNIRQKQVIGRARRICSHNELPEEERNVNVFQYIMQLTEEQIKGDKSIELRLKDKSKLDPTRIITTDESLYEIANIKENLIESLLQVIKETAIDCIHNDDSKNGTLNCFHFGNTTDQGLSYHESYSSQEKDDIEKQNKEIIKWKARVVSYTDKKTKNKKKYAMRLDDNGKMTYKLYDLESYHRAIENPNMLPIFIGTLITKGKNKGEIKYSVNSIEDSSEVFE